MKFVGVAIIGASALLATGCGSEVDQACDRAALDALGTSGPSEGTTGAQALLQACPGMPEPVARPLRGEAIAEAELPVGVWTCDAVPVERALDGAAGAAYAYGACGWYPHLGEGWDQHGAGFAWAQGRPIAGVLAGGWLRQAGYPGDSAWSVVSRVVGARGTSDKGAPVRLGNTPAFALTDEASADLVLGPDGLTEAGSKVDPARMGALSGVVTVLLVGSAEPAPSALESLGRLAGLSAGRVSRIDLVGRTPDGLIAIPVVPVERALGVATGPAVEVHVHAAGIMLTHGTTLRQTEVVDPGAVAERVQALLGEDVPGRVVRLVPHDAPLDTLAAAAQALAGITTVTVAPGAAACGNAPAGMVCVPGGTEGLLPGKPAGPGEPVAGHRVMSSFLVDVNRASLDDYSACVEAGGCGAIERRGDGPEGLSGLTWEEALRYCVFSGKTLPTEWQWQRAAQAEVLQDAASGPSEWTLGSYLEQPGRHALGLDPIGPCDGAEDCADAPHRSVRGGEGVAAETRLHDDPAASTHGVRCAAAWPVPAPTGAPELAPLEPPAQRLLDLFHGSAEDPIEQKPLCDGIGGQAHLDCRDPVTYIIGNEPRADLFMPFLDGVGGGYIGVAADNNYSQAAIAGTRWLWLMDYDPKVVSVHRMNGVFIRDSATPEAFADWYRPARRAEAQAKVRQELGDDELTDLALRNLRVWGDRLHEYYLRGMAPPQAQEGIDGKWVPAASPDFGWLRNKAHYDHVRTMWLQGRVRAVKGDMLGDVAMQGIGKAAREMGVPIRVYYTSNAPYAWGGMMEPSYRRNVRALPMDEHSILIQTLGSRTGFGQETYWHHSVVRGPLAQQRLGQPGFDHVSKIVFDRAYGGDPDLTVLGVAAPQ